MNAKQIDALYNEVILKPSGAHAIKFDLHVHTPASKDFISAKSMNRTESYLQVLEEALNAQLGIIAITDHNTFEGYNEVTRILNENNTLRNKYKNLLLLCGIEITCFSKHLLAIFPPQFDEKKQEHFLEEIGIPSDLRGKENALADVFGPAVLIEKIHEYGGFSILAHADSDNGFLHSFFKSSSNNPDELSFRGKSLAKIITSPYLLGVQLCNKNNEARLNKVFSNPDYRRNGDNLPFLYFSDCHGHTILDKYFGESGHKLGSIFSIAKLSEVSFRSIYMALSDAKVRVLDSIKEYDYPQIIGTAINSDILKESNKEYATFHFNPELNCVIGSRGTGKTTLLEIIQSVIMPNALSNDKVFDKYISAVVYIYLSGNIYAICNEPKRHVDQYTDEVQYDSKISIYLRTARALHFRNKKSSDDTTSLRIFLTLGYKQRQLYEYSRDPDKILDIIDDFIKWKNFTLYNNLISQIEYAQQELSSKLKEIEIKKECNSFINYIDMAEQASSILQMMSIISNSYQQLHKHRTEMVQELNQILRGKVKLTLSKKLPAKDSYEVINLLSERSSKDAGRYYDYQVIIKSLLGKVFALSSYENKFSFFELLLKRDYTAIIDSYKLQVQGDELDHIRSGLIPDCFELFLINGIAMEYNINMGFSDIGEIYRDNTTLSLGQNAVALLLLILNAAHQMSDNRPLIMDQPEDDLDNSYIYSTLVQEFRDSKNERQLIISTHNPNIPVAADAENIMVLKFQNDHGYLNNTGAIDKATISKDVLEILEGGERAIQQRISKYPKNCL